MSKYGKFDMQIPNYDEDIAALKDLLSKGEINRGEYQKRLSDLQRTRLVYIVATNGGHTPSKKAMQGYQLISRRLSELKQAHEANKLLETREQFLEEIQKASEQNEQSSEPQA